ncbi:MAG: methyl-accepting chemotaxis protein [Rubrivivax sp.]
MKNLSVRARLLSLVAIGALSTVAVSAMAWLNLQDAQTTVGELEASTVSVRASMNADMAHDASRGELLAAQVAALTGDAQALAGSAEGLRKALDELDAQLKKALDTVPDEASRERLRAAQPVARRYREATLAAYAALQKDSRAEAAMAAFHGAFEALEKALGASGDAIEQAATAASTRAADDLGRDRRITAALVAGALALLLLLGAQCLRSILRPLRQLLEATRDLDAGAGDLTRRLPPATAEFGQLSTHFNGFIERIGQVVAEVQRAAGQIAAASEQIASGNQDLSQRTEQTASSLQQTASSVEQINATVQQTAEAARQACELATQASGTASRGGTVVGRVVSTMEDITAASRRIADIIGTIDGIAFQTNILALNAAVEAARAGEQGRGFAVVAGEVRSLAQRSAEAAREIKTLIGSSVQRVESGSAQVRDAGQTMAEIVASVERVTQMIQEITTAAGEQSAGVALVNDAVTGLDRMTQQNAALVEESAAAAQALHEQAARLSGSVSGLRTHGA